MTSYLEVLPEFDAWGKASAKSPQNLWEEIQLGESLVTQDGFRKVRVVVAELRQHGTSDLQLVELEQTLADGRRRVRSKRPMAEKILGLEDPLTALKRGLFEELGLSASDFNLSTPQPVASSISRLSGSYPGMMSHYERFTFQVVTSALPQNDFTITEPDGIRCATWGWRKFIAAE